MDEQLVDDTAHTRPGPHVELRPEGLASFEPLKLVVQPGNVSVEVNQPVAVIGRHSEADVRLAFAEVSRRHCRVKFGNGQWRVEDLGSLNGVWINGDRMHEAVLYDGDRIRVGGCVITVERGTPMRVVTVPRKSDPELVLRDIASMMPRQVG